MLSSVRNQDICVIESDQSRNEKSHLSAPSHNNLPHQVVMIDILSVNRNDVTIEDQRRHRIAFYSKAERVLGVGTPVNGRCQHCFRPHLL